MSGRKQDPFLSVVIPAFNEADRLGPTIDRIVGFFRSSGVSGELLVVDDGSRDATAALVEEAMERSEDVALVRNGRNRGKGYTVRNGVRHARGKYVLFSDADLSTPIEEFQKLLGSLVDGADVAFASRQTGGARIEVRQPLVRRIMGRVFNLLVRAVAQVEVADSQCGFKCFTRRSARDIFALQRVEGFAFDVELLFLARKLGYRVAEVPVRWLDDPDSRVSRLLDPVKMFIDLIRIKSNELTGLYDRSVLARTGAHE